MQIKVVAEYDNGAVVGSPSREYIYSRGALLAKIAGSTTTYYHQDHLSNRLVTDSTGTTVAQLGHFPFGESWYNSTGDKLLFTSYERDSESGNDYAMARYDINRLGRFASPDPMAGSIGNPQSLNRYTYVLNNPVNMTDPNGTCPIWGPLGHCGSENGGGGGSIFGGGNFGTYIVDGIVMWPGQVGPILETGFGVGCPNNNCNGIRAQQGPGGTTIFQKWISGGNVNSRMGIIQADGTFAFLPFEGNGTNFDGRWETIAQVSDNGSGGGNSSGGSLSPDEQNIRTALGGAAKLANGPLNVLSVVFLAETAVIGVVEVTPAWFTDAFNGINNNPILRIGKGWNEAGEEIWRIASGGRWGKGGPPLPWHWHFP